MGGWVVDMVCLVVWWCGGVVVWWRGFVVVVWLYIVVVVDEVVRLV